MLFFIAIKYKHLLSLFKLVSLAVSMTIKLCQEILVTEIQVTPLGIFNDRFTAMGVKPLLLNTMIWAIIHHTVLFFHY